MADLAAQIAEARKHGYSDDDVISYLGTSHPELAPKIKEAQSNGYGTADILGHLSQSQQQKPADPNHGKYGYPGYTSALPWPLNKLEEAVSDSTHAMADGAQKLFGSGKTTDERLGGVSEMGRGFLNTAGVPFLLQAGGAAPLRTAKALGAAAVVHPVATATAKVLGAGPGTQDFVGDAASLVAGGLAARESAAPAPSVSTSGTPGPGAVRKVVNAVTNPLTADAVGMVNPHLAHALRMAGRIARTVDAVKAALGKTPAETVPEAAPVETPAPKPAQPPMPRDARRATAAVPETGVPESLERAQLARDQIAQDLTQTAYKDLSAADRAAVDDLVSRGYMGNEGAAPVKLGPPKPAPKPVSGPTRPAKPAAKLPPEVMAELTRESAPPAAQPAPTALQEFEALKAKLPQQPIPIDLARQLFDEMRQSGTAPAEASPEAAAPRDFAAEARASRTADATKLAGALKGNISLADANLMDGSHWKMLADGIGVKVPNAKGIAETLKQLQEMEQPAKPTAMQEFQAIKARMPKGKTK